jgi:hypothetical protein
MILWKKAALFAVAAVAVFLAGWTAQGWRKDAEIATIEKNQADARADASDAALADLTFATGVIREQAEKAQTARLDFQTDLNVISKELRDEIRKNKPLPVDCRPDADRVRSLGNAIDSADKAIAR